MARVFTTPSVRGREGWRGGGDVSEIAKSGENYVVAFSVSMEEPSKFSRSRLRRPRCLHSGSVGAAREKRTIREPLHLTHCEFSHAFVNGGHSLDRIRGNSVFFDNMHEKPSNFLRSRLRRSRCLSRALSSRRAKNEPFACQAVSIQFSRAFVNGGQS